MSEENGKSNSVVKDLQNLKEKAQTLLSTAHTQSKEAEEQREMFTDFVNLGLDLAKETDVKGFFLLRTRAREFKKKYKDIIDRNS